MPMSVPVPVPWIDQQMTLEKSRPCTPKKVCGNYYLKMQDIPQNRHTAVLQCDLFAVVIS